MGGFANAAGKLVITPKYFAAKPFKEGYAMVVTRKPWTPLGDEYGEFRLAQVGTGSVSICTASL
jgi:hypothetical protein